LLRLSLLANDSTYQDVATKLTKAFSQETQGAPEAYTFLLAGVGFAVGPSYSVLLIGDLKEKETADMLAALRKQYLPNLVVSLREPGKAGLGYEKIEGKATAYVCRNQMCLPPTNSIEKMLEHLGLAEGKR
jgi:uncharacterized protein YyaL (SSP411 family)